jgi:hypothetical protein
MPAQVPDGELARCSRDTSMKAISSKAAVVASLNVMLASAVLRIGLAGDPVRIGQRQFARIGPAWHSAQGSVIGGGKATWRSGYATVCKTVYSGSIPDVASTPTLVMVVERKTLLAIRVNAKLPKNSRC